MSLAIGEANIPALAPEHPGGDRQAAGHLGHVRFGHLPRALERDVHRAGRQVLDHLLVAHDGVVDGQREDLPFAVRGAAAEAPARLADDGLAPQLLTNPRHLGLNPLGRLEQPLEIGDRHQVLISFSAAPNTSCALRIRGCWRASFSRALRSAAAASLCCPTSERTVVPFVRTVEPLAEPPTENVTRVACPSASEIEASTSPRDFSVWSEVYLSGKTSVTAPVVIEATSAWASRPASRGRLASKVVRMLRQTSAGLPTGPFAAGGGADGICAATATAVAGAASAGAGAAGAGAGAAGAASGDAGAPQARGPGAGGLAFAGALGAGAEPPPPAPVAGALPDHPGVAADRRAAPSAPPRTDRWPPSRTGGAAWASATPRRRHAPSDRRER